ncbi:bifunctional YncE family protein/alkaline phosphatase family protein [Dyadobacter tibetensis]|uniref:bifunctional YncE family protein/alkaline phosphatase family protein n=1 Tax=Dyadobacter tibetensis TaxID=1211851 RepID=UPI00046F2C6B|nr:bifunctional YncE family protein/alkaline phosphatase family protein [Dyadobacter tibetensis]
MKKSTLLLILALVSTASRAQKWIADSPAGTSYISRDLNGVSTIPNGRLLTPYGTQYIIAPHPYGLAVSSDGRLAVTANSGTSPISISILDKVLEKGGTVRQIPEGQKTDKGILEACFMGLAIAPDNQTVYVAGGQANKIFMFDPLSGESKGTISCGAKDNGTDYSHGYIGDMTLSKDGTTLYAVDQIGFRLMVIDTKSRKIRYNIPTGRYPFGICLSPDEGRLYVANVGVFEYKPFTDLDPENLKGTAHRWPSSRYGSKEMKEGIPAEGVPALGDPNVPEAFSVWSYDLKDSQPTISAKIKTGILVGQMVEDFPAVGGSSPNSLAATDDYVFVSNGNNDCVSVIDIKKDTVVQNIFLNPEPKLGNLRGVIPFGLTTSPDQTRLYVAEAGINAVAVIAIPEMKVLGHIPSGWFPSKVKTSPDGKKLIVTNAKGIGSGPNGGREHKLGPEGSYIGSLMKGTVSVMDVPSDSLLARLTKQVIDNNFRFSDVSTAKTSNPVPLYPGESESPIKHIVFISKENRTYDEVFGQLPKGNGDPSIARYGLKRSFSNKNKSNSLTEVDVMPNHAALARAFGVSDNFYCDSDVSADGHRWLVNTYPNEWVETGTTAAYGGQRSMREGSMAPGNLAFYGSSGSIYPEDYNEAGSIWEHLERNKKDFFNFGFGVEMAANYSDSTMKHIGELYLANYPLPAPLFDKSSRIFPTYNMAIPDQFRADLFMDEFNEKWVGEDKVLPSVITLMLPNDHGTRERPHAGYPFTESYMADNDLALGRTVEFLSHTPYWKNMLIVVTEDDPQGGVDHMDAHRSILMTISPYAKRDYVGHQHYSFGSIFKTFWHILGIPYLNQYDATASDLRDLFTNTPDFTPYNAVAIDPQLFDPQKALDPFDEKFDWKAFAESEEMDRTETMQKRRMEDDDKLRKMIKKKKFKK